MPRVEVKLFISDCHSLQSTLLLDFFYQIFLFILHEILLLNSSPILGLQQGQGKKSLDYVKQLRKQVWFCLPTELEPKLEDF